MQSPTTSFSEAYQKAYVEIDRDLIVQAFSANVSTFSDCPDRVCTGTDIRVGFPELVGMEHILEGIFTGQRQSFQIKGIVKSTDPEVPFYVDLRVFAKPTATETADTPNRLVILFEDATERMMLEQQLGQQVKEAMLLSNALAASQEYLGKIIGSMADALIVTDDAGNIVNTNQAAQDLFAYTETEFTHRHISDLIDDPYFLSSVQAKLAQGENLRDIEVACKTHYGKSIYVEFSCSGVRKNLHENQYFIYVGRDITYRLQTEDAIVRALSQDRQLNRQKAKFIATASHEFRTPMTIIIMSVELLEQCGDRWDEAKRKTHFQRMRGAVDRAVELIENVSFINGDWEDASNLQIESVDLQAFCHKFADSMHNRYPLRTSDIVVEGNATAWVDRRLLRQALCRLFANAATYSSQGSPIRFQLSYQAGRAQLQLSDEGTGIPPEDLPHVFELFYRGSNVDTTQGAGLGLAIAQQAITIQQGTVDITSELGRGTTVCLTFSVDGVNF